MLARDESHSVREFTELAFQEIGIDLQWEGKGENEKGIDPRSGKALVEIDPRYCRPAEVDFLLGDGSKGKQ